MGGDNAPQEDGTGEPQGLVARLVARGKCWLKSKVMKMGQAALLAYILIDIACYAVLLLVVRTTFVYKSGKEPWEDPWLFLAAAAATWAGNNLTKPLRLAGAAALAAPLDWFLGKLAERWQVSRLIVAAVMVGGWGSCAIGMMTGWVLISRYAF
mmetsp:Transcript_4303/g.6871  ORF Transcript_4303/g.6871 Transcript_4303/m.6871 type:complete len:154 (+) Transcript_4303:75-536(+)